MGTKITGRAYSSRERVNVVLPGTGPRGEGNHFYPPARGPVEAYVWRCVNAALAAEAAIGQRHGRKVAQCFATPADQVQPGPEGRGLGSWAFRPVTVSIRPEVMAPGAYHVTVSTDD